MLFLCIDIHDVIVLYTRKKRVMYKIRVQCVCVYYLGISKLHVRCALDHKESIILYIIEIRVPIYLLTNEVNSVHCTDIINVL